MTDQSQCYYFGMRRAGFVLVGGASSRMGRDKALLPYEDTVLAERVAREVEKAAGSAVLVGPPERYEGLRRPIIADQRPGNGPLGGLEAALAATEAEWNLIVACDMPGVSAAFLGELLDRAEAAGADCLVPYSGPGRAEPLCAVYHRRCLGPVRSAIDRKRWKLMELLAELKVARWEAPEGGWAENVNTAGDWKSHQRSISQRHEAEKP